MNKIILTSIVTSSILLGATIPNTDAIQNSITVPKTIEEKQDAKKSAISNAYYTLQFTYQKEMTGSENPLHGQDIFNYGYIICI